MVEQAWWRPALAEFLGTFMLCFMGIGAIVSLNQFTTSGSQDAAFLVGVALAHGLTIAVMVNAVGHISGGHFNPAVTIGALVVRRIKFELGAMYILFQLLGAIIACIALQMVLPSSWWDPVNLGLPTVADPGLGLNKALLIEAILTFFLVFVIFGAAIDARNSMRPMAGFAIGLTITVDILMGGYLTGAAMNPARWFGPALLVGDLSQALVYVGGPILGGIAAALVYDSAYFTVKKAPSPQPPEPLPPADTPPPST